MFHCMYFESDFFGIFIIFTYFDFCIRRIDDQHTNGSTSFEYRVSPPDDERANSEANSYAKRPVSMFETREGLSSTKSGASNDARTTTSMYQMVDGQPPINGNSNGKVSTNSLPHSDDVKVHTEVVTRRIQELWTAMQEMNNSESFVPCAERIKISVNELSALFPDVS